METRPKSSNPAGPRDTADEPLAEPVESNSYTQVHVAALQQSCDRVDSLNPPSPVDFDQQAAPETWPLGPKEFVTQGHEYQLPPDLPTCSHLITRILLDILIFSYSIEDYNVQQGLQECTPPLLIKGFHAERASLLSTRELHTVSKYAEAISKVCENVARNSQSLLSDYDRAFIVSFIMQPARQLGINPTYLLEQLLSFRIHMCRPENRKKTLLYTKNTSIWARGLGLLPSKWSIGKNHKLLACRLVSDDIAVTQLGERICERLRLVLGQAIKKFSDKNCKYGMGNVKREVYADPVCTALVQELNSWEVAYRKKIKAAREKMPKVIAPPESELAHRNNPVVERAKSHRDLYSIHEHEEVPRRPRSSLGFRSSSAPTPDFAQRFKSATLGLDPLTRVSGWRIPANSEPEAIEPSKNFF
ncbi:hypothetical protein GMOD_00003467 [Pyrenophora seminiperda CCB06]|uniref:Uncharacterized protein n=1 Tax=Pyrenophora seminiperda CCB06 TaxID=1302712 RepID=A0A3M7MIW5_9PLEO|nr:hypothetical protein GMOD_00003467 [Pyrenophora seminiperda CCB06]